MAKRGRPRKNPKKSLSKDKSKKKVGRPRKNLVPKLKTKKIKKNSNIPKIKAKRGRGRPKKIKKSENEITTKEKDSSVTNDPSIPKRRGRKPSRSKSSLSSKGIKSNVLKIVNTRRKLPILSDDSDSEAMNNSKTTESDFVGRNSSIENSISEDISSRSDSNRNGDNSRTKTTTTSTTEVTKKPKKIKCNSKLLEEILFQMKNIQNQQEMMEDNMNAMLKLFDKKTDMIQNQTNLVGLISLASMNELRLPVHLMGIIKAFSDQYSEEITNEYINVLINGLGEGMRMMKMNALSQKESPADEFIKIATEPQIK